MREQGKAAAWCGRLLLFAALIAGIVAMHTFGHPTDGHGGHETLTAAGHPAPEPMAMTGPMAVPVAAPMTVPMATHRADRPAAPLPARPIASSKATTTAAHPPTHPTALTVSDSASGGGAMDPGTVCRAVLSVWATALLVLLGVGLLLGQARTGVSAALRARLLRGLRPLPPPPRHKLLARLSVLRV
ncbi:MULTISPECIES: hypothetical protein [Streptomyces]|uniref:hypothetical protein n=1 Tax=Streptomyces TaxID=1883 RepID=UPI00069A6D4D|nr:hypothetical protein [Streptomyces sp. SID7805]MYU52761.1 hypothetical protein [Streptomyces sp. SID7805]